MFVDETVECDADNRVLITSNGKKQLWAATPADAPATNSWNDLLNLKSLTFLNMAGERSRSSPFRAIISDIFWGCFNLKSVAVEKLQQLPRARPEELLVQDVDQWNFVDHFVGDVEFCRRTRKLLLHVSCANLLFLMSSDSNSIGSLLLEINTIPKDYVDVFKGVIVTCTPSREKVASDELWLEKFSTDDGTKAKYDCATRYFAPWLGIPEDPVNGASHTVLVGYWTKQLGIEIVRAFQASTREGELAKEENKTNRMYMRGYAVTVLKGSLCL